MAVVRRLGASVLLTLSGCALLVDIPEVPNSEPDDVRRKEIRLDPGLGGDPPIQLLDHTVPITIVNDPEIAARARFENIRFTDEDDEPVDYEIEHYDPATGSVHAWVRLPVVRGDITLLHIYYGGPDVEDPPDPSSVWPDELYAGVWHLSNEAPRYPDSSFGGNVFEQAAASPPEPIDGAFGNAILFDGQADQHLVVADPDDGSLDFADGTFALTVWVRVETPAGADDVPVSKGGLSQASPGYGIHMGTGTWRASFGDGSEFVQLTIGEPDAFLNDWHVLGFEVNREEGFSVACIVGDDFEGVCDADVSEVTSVDSTADLEVGTNYEGRIDEIRLYRQPLPRGVPHLEYNARTKVDFYELGPETVP